MLMLSSEVIFSQVISNNGAAISVTSGIIVSSKDANNNSGSLINGGTITLSGNYLNAATTSNAGLININGNFTSNALTNGNGTFRIGGNWTNTGGTLSGNGTVIFNGSTNQSIIRSGGETFYNLAIDNSGAISLNRINILNNVTVQGTLSMSRGNIDAGIFKLLLSNQAAASLNYTSTSGSRIFGKFERGINQAGTYLFPLGTSGYYNPANLITNSLPVPGTVLSEFITSPPPGDAGLPIPDPPVEIARAYKDGYWSFTANSFSTGNFSVNLNASGFIDSIRDISRVIKRTSSTGNWTTDGTHSNADTVSSVVFRNNLTGGISPAGTQFAVGRSRPLITLHPVSLLYACEATNPSFSINATGAGLLTYRWYKEPGTAPIANGAHYSGARTPTLTILGAVLSDAGYYYCIVTDRYGNSTRSNSGELVVNRIPVATLTPSAQDHECSNIPFDNIVLGESYGVPLTTYTWSRTNPSGITSGMPTSGTSLIIGDILSGSFINTTDAPVTITFTIVPTGQSPTYCMGLPVTATVTVNPTPRVIPDNIKPVICYDGTTSITLTTPTTMTNGVIQFDYTVNIPAPGVVLGNTSPANNLSIGSKIIFPYKNNSDTIRSVFYLITPKNVSSGCFSGPVVPAEVKVHPHPLQSNIIIVKPLTCEGGSDASLRINTSKGAGPYMMIWDGPLGFPHTEGYGITNLTGVPGGQYDVTVIDNNGCTSATNIPISGAYIDSRMDVIGKPPSGYGTSCPGSADGEIRVRQNASSTGLPPFNYWIVNESQDTVVHDVLNSIGVYNPAHKNLAPGTYRLFLKDANGCYDLNYPEVEIIDPDTIKVEFNKSLFAGGFNVKCTGYNDGSVSVKTITGGNGNYTYKWYTNNGTITGPDNLDRLDNITAGTYYLITNDFKNCSKLDSVTITEPQGMQLTGYELSLKADGSYNISCAGGDDGYIKINITGGSGTYLYSWIGPSGFSATTKDISGLKAGNYRCIVTDLNGCTLTSPQYTLIEPSPLVVNVTTSTSISGSHNINCYGGTASINLYVTGGIPGTYNLVWSTSDGSGLVNGQEDQNSLSAGSYKVIVTDKNGCQVTKDITITQPQPLKTKLIPTHITCKSGTLDNGSIDLILTGGVAPFRYLWSNAATTEDLTGLSQGKYIVNITDANGCQTNDSTVIKLPPPLSFTKELSDNYGYNVSCNGMSNGYIRINPVGGTAPFTYSWTGPGLYTSNSKDIMGLGAGAYNLMISDSNLCTASETINITEPGKLDMIISLSNSIAGGYNINCAGESTGFIGIEPLNHVGEVNFFWSDGSIERTRTKLPAGEYGVIITDMNNCHADTVVTLTQPDSIKIRFDLSQPFCPDMSDGEIRLNVNGGVIGTDYLYKWSNINASGRNISNLLRGTYKVFVTDLNGCTIKDSVKLEPLNETCLVIPNAFSPDNNLVNDFWNIGMIGLYPKAEVRIFNRWGETVWRSEAGYPDPWDGTSNGVPLPIDSYHYIIDLHNGSKPIIGNVTIVRVR
jgi:gliding motility-associated-like protein